MKKITDNATFRMWIIDCAKKQKKTRYEVCIKVGKITNNQPDTVYRWQAKNSKQILTAGNAALIQAAIERGEI